MLDTRVGLIGFLITVLLDGERGPGLALVELSVVEQWYRAVLAVGRGEQKTVVVAQFGCHARPCTPGSPVTPVMGWPGGSVTVALLVSASGAGRTLGARMRAKWSTQRWWDR
jgi:hypothetical protein